LVIGDSLACPPKPFHPLKYRYEAGAKAEAWKLEFGCSPTRPCQVMSAYVNHPSSHPCTRPFCPKLRAALFNPNQETRLLSLAKKQTKSRPKPGEKGIQPLIQLVKKWPVPKTPNPIKLTLLLVLKGFPAKLLFVMLEHSLLCPLLYLTLMT
jgi:hypothetical protein